MKNWEDLPVELQLDEVRPYYEILKKKQFSLIIKRLFDLIVSFLLLIILFPLFFAIALAIKLDSKGPVFYRQERATQYGEIFRIHKFRSMYVNADSNNVLVTAHNDNRITKIGSLLRKSKIDELAQLIDILEGNMSFVGTRPEVLKYVDKYENEYKATLLLKAGITSSASIEYRYEERVLDSTKDIDKSYLEDILPIKMKYNLEDINKFSLIRDLMLLIKTILAIIK